MGIILLPPSDSIIYIGFILLVASGLAAAAAVTYAASRLGFFAFSLPALVPLAIFALFHHQLMMKALGSITLLYSALVGLASICMNKSTVQALSSQLEKLELTIKQSITKDELSLERERALVTLHSIADGVITTDEQDRVQYMNPIAEQLTGWTHAEARQRDLPSVCNVVDERTRGPVHDYINPLLSEGRIVERERSCLLLLRSDGQEFAVEHTATLICNPEGQITGAVIVFYDVTERRELAEQLSYQASHDTLTGLINRREFEERLQLAIETAKRDREQHALLYMDLDQFKVVNDTCGHISGDQLLM